MNIWVPGNPPERLPAGDTSRPVAGPVCADAADTRIVASPPGNPTVPRILLGAQLRRLRTLAGVSMGAAGYAIRSSHVKISRMELGRVGFDHRDVGGLLTLYGVHDQSEREALLALCAHANTRSWWHAYADLVPGWLEDYLGLEDAAVLIRCYHTRLVPDLLQSEDYARTAIRAGHPSAVPQEIERRVRLRMDRARLLHRPQPPKLWAVIEESVLRRAPNGDNAMMRDQIDHLARLSRLPNVTVQVKSRERNGHVALGSGPFTMMRFAEATLSDIVYRENPTGVGHLGKADDPGAYAKLMDQLCLDAVPAAATPAFLTDVAESL